MKGFRSALGTPAGGVGWPAPREDYLGDGIWVDPGEKIFQG